MTGPTDPAWRVITLSKAKKKLLKMPRPERERIVRAFKQLAQDPFSLDMKPLKGSPLWRLRVGGWRILLRMDREKQTLHAVSVRARGDVYK